MSEPLPKKPIHKRWWFWPVAILLGLGAIGSVLPESEEQKAERAKAEAERVAKEKERELKKEADRKQGFHCLSQWDGSSAQLIAAIKPALRNPDSFEHIETRIAPRDDQGQHRLVMQYRAENGFGGMNVETIVAIIDGDSCNVKSVLPRE